MANPRLIFITGTDTGVGKTVLTALLLSHLRSSGHKALAIKPFCSGNPRDTQLLQRLQQNDLTPLEITPWFFAEPVAPLAAARLERRRIRIDDVVRHIRAMASRCKWLLVEGAGGLLAPLGEGYSLLELVRRLRPKVVVAAANKLGTINHTLLTVRTLRATGIRGVDVVLLDSHKPDHSSASNAEILAELLPDARLTSIPFLGARADSAAVVRQSSARLHRPLNRILR